MANITSPQAISFCNTNIRPLADFLSKAYYLSKILNNSWTAQGMATLIPNDALAQVMDGADSDGRPIIFGADVNAILTAANAVISNFEATSNARLNQLLKVAVNPNP